MTTSTARRALVGATWLTGGGYVSFLVTFTGNLLLVRLLFPDDFGTFALIAALVELLSVLAGLAFSQGIIQMPEEPAVEDTAYRLTIWLCLLLLFIGAIAAGVTGVLRGATFAVILLVVLGVRLLTTLSYVYSAPLEREFRHRSLAGVRLLAASTSMGVAIALAAGGAGVWSLVGREAVLAGVMFAGLRAVTPWRYSGQYSAQTARRLLRFASGIFATRTLEVLSFRADVFLLGLLAGTVALGFYDRARFLGELGHYSVSFAAVQVALPLYASLKNDPVRLGEAYRVTHYFLVRLMLPFAAVLIVLPDELVLLLFGARWEQAIPSLRWLAGYAFLLPILDNMKVLLTGTGRVGEAFRIRLVQAAVIMSALLVLVPRWGAVGAAAAMSGGSAAGAFAAYYVLRRHVADLALRTYAAPVLAATLAGIATAVSQQSWLPGPGRVGSAAALALAALVYLSTLIVLERAELLHNFRIIRPARGTMQERPS